MSQKYASKKKNLEREIDKNLLVFSQLKEQRNKSSEKKSLLAEEDYNEVKIKLDGLLTEYSSMIEGLVDEADETLDVTLLRTVKSLRENYATYMAEFRQTDSTIVNIFERDELLGYNDDSNKHGYGEFKSRSDAALSENMSIQNSQIMVDEQISLVLDTRERLHSQRNALKGVQKKVGDIFINFPKINNLIQRIHTRKRKEAIIIGVVVALCTYLVLSYILF